MLNTDLMKKGEVIAVALSGGKDSVCLLDMLLTEKGKLGITVKAVNIDHGIRGETSVRDSEFVKSLCDKFGVPLFFKKIDCVLFSEENGFSPEEGARILRYKVFDEVIKSGFCDKIATAHHASDRAETVLFNILRGASPLGASGISEESRGGKIIRPMLTISRREIDDYAVRRGLSYVVDETNLETEYTRNFLRLEVLPLIEKRFPEAEKSILRFADTLKADEEYLTETTKKSVTEKNGEISFPCDLPYPIFLRASFYAMKKLGIQKDYEKIHGEAVYSLKNSENGKKITLPKNIFAVKDYDKITFYKTIEKGKPNDQTIFETPFALGEYEFAGKKYKFEIVGNDSVKSGDNRLIADLLKIPDTAVLRNRRGGDVFRKFGGGTKKLKDYLIDKKVPSRERDKLLLLADGANVLIICGIEISDAIKVDKATRNVLQCTLSDMCKQHDN